MTVRPVGIDRHNEVLAAATARAAKLEGRLADVIEPILASAGREAVARFRQAVTDHLSADASFRYALAGDAGNADVSPDSTMICLKPRPDEAAAVADPDGDPADRLHVTLVYLGETDGPLMEIAEALRPVAAACAPLAGVVGGYGRFEPPGVGILLPDVRGLVELRVAVTEALLEAGIDYARNHGFQPHMTVHADPEPGQADAALERAAGAPLHFDAILVVRGDVETVEVPLVGTPPLTAAGNPPPWTPPFPDELVDVDDLTAQIRAKTDPVRDAMVQATMTPTLKAAGLDWSVTNPLTAKVLAGAGAKVTHIAQTTQLNVMRIIRSSYENGLSIPQTAEAIQAGMSSASLFRATMIARTELAAAANGGSLAATQIVAGATGEGYVKKWLTAPGAPNPRHELYEGLDGQTVELDGYFDVGDAQLQYPGDPDGDPGETINCRCALVYDTPEGEQEADADSPPSLDEGSADDAGGEGDGGGGGGQLVLGPPAGDSVSVSAGPPVPEAMVARIDDLGLNRPLDDLTPTTATGSAVYSAAKDTEGLYRQGGDWTPDRKALHDDIIAAHFDGKAASGGTPTAYFTAGGGASGKSHALFDVGGTSVGLKELGARADTVWVDPDRIKAMLPEYAKLRDANDLYAAQGVHEESSALAKAVTEEAQRRGLSTVIDTTGSSSGFVRKLEAARAAGYDVQVTMFSTPTNEAIVRSMSRGDRSGRYVSIRALKSAHAGASRNLGIWKDAPGVAEWRVYDNSGAKPELIAEGRGGKATVYDQQKFDAVLAKAKE